MKTQEEEPYIDGDLMNRIIDTVPYSTIPNESNCEDIYALIQSELSSQREELEAKHKEELAADRQNQSFKVIQSLVKSGSISDYAASTVLALHTSQLTKSKKGEE